MKLSNNFTMKHTTKNIREDQVNYYEQDIKILNYIEALDYDDLVIKSLYKLVLLKLENELLNKINSVIELKPYVCSNNALCVKAVITAEDRTILRKGLRDPGYLKDILLEKIKANPYIDEY